jgi:hypothetical protein
MQSNYERVICPIQENPVIADATIVNTTYDCDGYRISCISMSKGTYMALERFRSPVLIMVRKGEMRIDVKGHDDTETRSALIKAGQGYFRPANEYAGYFADTENVIFTEIVLCADSEIAMRIIPHLVQDIMHLVHYEPGQVSRSHLINDEFFQLNMLAYSESEKIDFCCSKQPVSIDCIEGKVTIQHEEDKNDLLPGNSFRIPADYACTVFVSCRTKIIVLYLSDAQRHII